MVDPEWSSAVAAVVDDSGVVRGTAFFIGDDVAMTCHHVLAAAGSGPVRLRRSRSPELLEVSGVETDEALDLALVRVAGTSDTARLVFEEVPSALGSQVLSHGFPVDHPASEYPDGFPLAPAVLAGQTTFIWRGQAVEQLILTGSDFEEGFSGAPSIDMDTGRVTGVLTKFEASGRTGYAVPARLARLRWPELPVTVTPAGPTFDDVARVVDAVAPHGWATFDPSGLQCVVVSAECDPAGQLTDVLTAVLARPGASGVWDAFAAATDGCRLLDGHVRSVSLEFSKQRVKQASFNVVEAFASLDSLATATRLLVEADVALFDVTGFEPGVMLLMGIRAATRRGVTIASHGGGWLEGEPLDRPFNLSDLSLASHTAVPGHGVGRNPRVERLAERIVVGFEQSARHPSYLDLPVYDALRRLGSQEAAWASIPLEVEILVLCSYHEHYFRIWEKLQLNTETALSDISTPTTVARLQDLATPQLVSQMLYERIRRCAACIADWTFASPSTFLELGVRLVVSPWSAVQIAQAEWLAAPTNPAGKTLAVSAQIGLMHQLFDPLPYRDVPDRSTGERIAQQLISIREQVQGRGGHPIRQAAIVALARVDRQLPRPDAFLREEADSLNHQGRTRTNVPQALFYEAKSIKADQERAALERRLAAWLYLEHRLHAGELPDADPSKQLWRELGDTVVADLYLNGEDADMDLAQDVEGRLG